MGSVPGVGVLAQKLLVALESRSGAVFEKARCECEQVQGLRSLVTALGVTAEDPEAARPRTGAIAGAEQGLANPHLGRRGRRAVGPGAAMNGILVGADRLGVLVVLEKEVPDVPEGLVGQCVMGELVGKAPVGADRVVAAPCIIGVDERGLV